MARSSLLRSALGATFLASVATATPAHALEPKQCLPMAEMNAALKAEGQHTMIIGNREALDNPTGKIVDASVRKYTNAVTSNDDGSLGYQLEGDKPREQISTEMCVAAKLTNIRMFDATVPGVPHAALLGGRIDEVMRKDDQIGSRPMVLADTMVRAANGGERKGLPMIVSGNIPYRAGLMMTRKPDGEPLELMQLGALEYTPLGLQRAKGSTTLAMLDPKVR